MQELVAASYDLPRIFDAVDFATIMAYEYHGFYTLQHYTGHPTPLYRRPEEGPSHPGYGKNVFDSVNFMLQNGADRSKMVLGVAAHGNGFHLSNTTANGLYCDSDEGLKILNK